jgi:hypothetical protein
MAFYAFIDFNFKNINQKYLEPLIKTCEFKNESEFVNILLNTIQFPIKSYSFCKEINRKMWFQSMYYNPFVSYPGFYFMEKLLLYNSDILFVQFAILIYNLYAK